MSRLTQEMKDMIAAHQCFIGTVNKAGIPKGLASFMGPMWTAPVAE